MANAIRRVMTFKIYPQSPFFKIPDFSSPPSSMWALWERKRSRVSPRNHTGRWLPMVMSTLTSTSTNFHSWTFCLENNPMVLDSLFLDQWFLRWDFKLSVHLSSIFKIQISKKALKLFSISKYHLSSAAFSWMKWLT